MIQTRFHWFSFCLTSHQRVLCRTLSTSSHTPGDICQLATCTHCHISFPHSFSILVQLIFLSGIIYLLAGIGCIMHAHLSENDKVKNHWGLVVWRWSWKNEWMVIPVKVSWTSCKKWPWECIFASVKRHSLSFGLDPCSTVRTGRKVPGAVCFCSY